MPLDLQKIPSVDSVMRSAPAQAAIERFGRPAVTSAIRAVLDRTRAAMQEGAVAEMAPTDIAAAAVADLEAGSRPNLRPVFNLTGTILHTNLGRAILAEEAVQAAVAAMRQAMTVEFDLKTGRRGERDDHIKGLLTELTGAESATVVNNNAAALLLVLNTFGKGRQAIVSRGELIEIGGAFRLPEIMTRAGTKLVEVGTTNRTHRADYAAALNPRTGLLLKVHTSNYRIEGFTAEVETRELAQLARGHGIPLVHDLGSGTLVDLSRYGLPKEPTVDDSIHAGADLVTFSGDKLLGGPQAGFIVGRADLIQRINRNPLKRALRLDKIRLAALEATLKLYRDPERLSERLPVMRHIARSEAEIAAQAQRLMPHLSGRLGNAFALEVVPCRSQVGSGALPQQTLSSAGIAIRPASPRGAGRLLAQFAAALRGLPIPIIGRVADNALILDCRCLDDEAAFLSALESLRKMSSGA